MQRQFIKPGFLLSAMHSRFFRWFSAAPLGFLFLGFLPLQLNQIWQILCVMYEEEGGGGGGGDFVLLFICLLFRRCSVSILVIFPIFRLLK
jgi:hypothetical protein